MKWKIIWSPLALTRVNEETEYIARDKPGAAERWADGIFETVERLSVFPESGRVLPALGKPNVRELTYRNHRVIYRIEGERVLILTVRHWRRLLDISEVDRP